jgi:hypothetical protein
MPLDENGSSPIVNGKKRTTKANMFIVFAVLILFVIGACIAWQLLQHPPRDIEPGHDLGVVFHGQARVAALARDSARSKSAALTGLVI